jgi:hypothetical protein
MWWDGRGGGGGSVVCIIKMPRQLTSVRRVRLLEIDGLIKPSRVD